MTTTLDLQYRSKNGGWDLFHPRLKRWVDERSIPPEDRPWRPFVKATTSSPYKFADRETFWANSHYLVFRREFLNEDGTVALVHLSMRTVENDVRHDWREMQRVKNELCGTDWEAAELYPSEDRVVDMANQWHLWAFPFVLPFGFPAGIRSEPDDFESGVAQRPGAGSMPVAPPDELAAAARAAGAKI